MTDNNLTIVLFFHHLLLALNMIALLLLLHLGIEQAMKDMSLLEIL